MDDLVVPRCQIQMKMSKSGAGTVLPINWEGVLYSGTPPSPTPRPSILIGIHFSGNGDCFDQRLFFAFHFIPLSPKPLYLLSINPSSSSSFSVLLPFLSPNLTSSPSSQWPLAGDSMRSLTAILTATTTGYGLSRKWDCTRSPYAFVGWCGRECPMKTPFGALLNPQAWIPTENVLPISLLSKHPPMHPPKSSMAVFEACVDCGMHFPLSRFS